MIESVHTTAETIRNRIATGLPVIYSRYGDGELHIMGGENRVQNQPYSPALARELRVGFNIVSKGYLVGSVAGIVNEGEMRPKVFGRFGSDDHLQKLQADAANAGHEYWANAIALHYKFCFEPEWWLSFRDLLIDATKLRAFVGPGWAVKGIEQHFKTETSCVTPDRDAYADLLESEATIGHMLRYGLIVLACGPTANVICARLYKMGYEGIALDVGSIADCMAGVKSRGWIREEGDKCRGRYL